jgi:Skp family chaperone for outer membrane proteins
MVLMPHLLAPKNLVGKRILLLDNNSKLLYLFPIATGVFFNKNEMKKIVYILTLLTAGFLCAQKPQTIAYIDMEYILESIPAYKKAQKKLDNKVATWRKEIDEETSLIEEMKAALRNEKILLTEDIISERNENIQLKEIALHKKKATYFGEEGSLFLLRQQLVKPIQNDVYNAIQRIVKRKKYDFVVDRSSDLVLLHANPKYDISKIVIAYITKSIKEQEIEERKEKKSKTKEALQKRIEDQRRRSKENEKKIIRR